MDKEDGGAAFPSLSVHTDRNGEVYSERIDGMPLRDYFAAKAMHGVLRNFNNKPLLADHEASEKIATAAYLLADAMLKARSA